MSSSRGGLISRGWGTKGGGGGGSSNRRRFYFFFLGGGGGGFQVDGFITGGLISCGWDF